MVTASMAAALVVACGVLVLGASSPWSGGDAVSHAAGAPSTSAGSPSTSPASPDQGTAPPTAGTAAPTSAPTGGAGASGDAARRLAPALPPPGARALGPVPPDASIEFDVWVRPRDPAGLEAFAAAVSTPTSPQFHRYLDRGEYARRFGPAPEQVAAVRKSLADLGLRVTNASAGRLTVQATAAQVQRALHPDLRRYALADGTSGMLNRAAPELPAAIAGDVQAVTGFDTLNKAHPLAPGAAVAGEAGAQTSTSSTTPCAEATTKATASTSYTTDQVAAAYGFDDLYAAGHRGAGQTIAVLELEPYSTTDVATYAQCFGLTPHISHVVLDGGPGFGAGSAEAAMDIQIVMSAAPDAHIIDYEAPNTATDLSRLYQQMADDDVAGVISVSWGKCEDISSASERSLHTTAFQQMAAQGQSILVASGDTGSEGCERYGTGDDRLAVQEPGDNPYVTVVGGTSLTSPTTPPVESVWNLAPDSQWGSGGGISKYYVMPAWQAGDGVVSSYSSGTPCAAPSGSYCRQVPDVAASADQTHGYVFFWQGKWVETAGTSAATPMWASLTALGNEMCASGPLGFLNPSLYALDSPSGRYGTDFNDITVGNNDVTGTHGGAYPATADYDMATGLGTPRAAGVVGDLCAPPVTAGAPSAITLGAATVAGSNRSVDVSGRVVDSAGSGVPDVIVALSTTAGTVAPSVVTDSGGRFAATLTTPSTPGSLTVTATAAGLAAQKAVTVVAYPVVTSLSTSSASKCDPVEITGSGFTGVGGSNGVYFGDTQARSYTVNSDTSITAYPPAGTYANVDVRVVKQSIPSDTSTADLFSSSTLTRATGADVVATPALGGAADATWRYGFTTSCLGAMSSGGHVTLHAPSGTTFPAVAADYQVTDHSGRVGTATTVAVASDGTSPTPNVATLTVPSPLSFSYQTVETVTVNGVGNPPTGTTPASQFTVSTSTDTIAAAVGSGLDFTTTLTGFAGTVTDSHTGLPLAGACAYLYTASGARTLDPGACSDATGAYAEAVARPGTYHVAFLDPSGRHVTQWYSNRATGATGDAVDVVSGSSTGAVSASMNEVTAIAGTVTDEHTGAPLAGVCVYAYTPAGSRTSDRGTCTDSAGRYLMPIAGPGTYRVAFADPSGMHVTRWYDARADQASSQDVAVAANVTTDGIDAVMPELTAITGVLTDASYGYKLSGICAYLYTAAGVRTADPGVCSSSSGVYTLPVSSPGTYIVAFYTPSGAYLTGWYAGGGTMASATPVTVTAGVTTTGVDVALLRPAAISGHVAKAVGGASYAGVCVYADDLDGNYTGLGACTDAYGNFTIRGLEPGSYKLGYYVPGQPQGVGAPPTDHWYDGASDEASADAVVVTQGATVYVNAQSL